MQPIGGIDVSRIAADIESVVFSGKLETLSVSYMGGFLVKRFLAIRDVNGCENCQKALTSNS